MTIIVVTGSRAVRKAFASAERSRTYSVEFHDGDTRRAFQRAREVPDSFLYVDVTGMDARTVKRHAKRLGEERPYRFGVIDPERAVTDIAELFRNAAADYVGRELMSQGFTTARLRRTVEFEPVAPVRPAAGHVPEHENHRVIPSGTDWSSVRDGEVYTFVMLYAGIDQAGDLRRKSSEGFLTSLRRSFSTMLEREFGEYGARVWMWKEDEGLLLMPFDGRTVDAVVPALRLVLNRWIVNAEEFSQFGELSWRLALHLGNTTYRSTGRTGAIVSESVNFLFHLGAKFVEPGGLAVTDTCHPYVPDGVRPLLNHRGEFESIHIYTLRDLL